MRPTTEVYLMIRNVGKPGEELKIGPMAFPHAARDMAKWMLTQEMANRFDVSICRNESDLDAAMNAASRKQSSISESMDAMFDPALFE